MRITDAHREKAARCLAFSSWDEMSERMSRTLTGKVAMNCGHRIATALAERDEMLHECHDQRYMGTPSNALQHRLFGHLRRVGLIEGE